jgi:alpha-beta hydrolase superfamily lysophospholipase
MRIPIRLIVTTLLASIVGAYLLLMLGAFVVQRSIMYPAPRVAEVPQASRGTLIRLDGLDGRNVFAYHVPAHEQNPTLVVFHGNAEQLADQTSLAEDFAAAGLGTYAVEYPGYGLSSSSRTTEANVYADSEAALRHLEQKLGVPREKMVLFGWSLGTGVAIEMALRGFGARVVLLSAYTSMVELAATILPIVPTKWLILDRYDTLSKAPRIRQPTLLVHGSNDDVIPCAMSERVAARLPVARLSVVPHADHHNLLLVGGEELWQRIVRFAAARN